MVPLFVERVDVDESRDASGLIHSGRVPSGSPGVCDPHGLSPVFAGMDATRHDVLPDGAQARLASDAEFRRENTIIEKNGVYAYNDGRFGASFDEQGFEFAPASPQPDPSLPHLRLDLIAVTDGSNVIAKGGPAGRRVLPQERVIEYDRGAVVERYAILAAGVEQFFTLHSRPQHGDITVTIQATSNGGIPRADGRQVLFPGPTGGAITVSDAVVYDAGSRRLDLELQVTDGQLSMTVPYAWASLATLPITIDPVVGSNIIVDASTGGVAIRPAQVAYNTSNGNWLVVWNEQVGASAFDYDIWAQRIANSGALVGAPIAISNDAAGAYECAVAYSSTSINRFMIAWRGDPADDGNSADQSIYGRMLNGNGTFFNAAAVLDGDINDDYNPRLAWDGTRFYLAYTAVIVPNTALQPDWDIQGSFWSSSMAFVSICDAAAGIVDLSNNANIGFGGNQHLVVWEASPSLMGGQVGTREIIGRRLNTGTQQFAGAAFLIDTSTNDSCHASVAFGGSRWTVVWDEKGSSGVSGFVRRRRVNTNGTFQGGVANVASVQYGYPGYNAGGWPVIGFTPGTQQFLAVWHSYVATEDATSMLCRRINPNGTTAGGIQTVIQAAADVDARYAGMALRPGNNRWLIVAWDSWDPGAIRARRFDMP